MFGLNEYRGQSLRSAGRFAKRARESREEAKRLARRGSVGAALSYLDAHAQFEALRVEQINNVLWADRQRTKLHAEAA